MKKLKKFAALLLAGALVLSVLTGCSGSAAAVTTKNIVEALNDYTTLWNIIHDISTPAVNHVMQFHLAYCTTSIVRKCQQQRNVF